MKSVPKQKEGWHLNYAEIIFYLFFFKCWAVFFIIPPILHVACSNPLPISEYSTIKPWSSAICFYGKVLSWMSFASGVAQTPDSGVKNSELSLVLERFEVSVFKLVL